MVLFLALIVPMSPVLCCGLCMVTFHYCLCYCMGYWQLWHWSQARVLPPPRHPLPHPSLAWIISSITSKPSAVSSQGLVTTAADQRLSLSQINNKPWRPGRNGGRWGEEGGGGVSRLGGRRILVFCMPKSHVQQKLLGNTLIIVLPSSV